LIYRKVLVLVEIDQRLVEGRSIPAVPLTIWLFLTGLASHSKKSAHAAERSREDVKAAREAGFDGQHALEIKDINA
jgi:hypothetical protein